MVKKKRKKNKREEERRKPSVALGLITRMIELYHACGAGVVRAIEMLGRFMVPLASCA